MKFGEKRSAEVITAAIIAPYGMNCAICMGFLRDARGKNWCPGFARSMGSTDTHFF